MGIYNNFNNYRNNRFANMNFVNNSAPRCPVFLLVDTSISMDGEPINELNAAIRQFVFDLQNDEIASSSVELEIISFDNKANIVIPCTPISELKDIPVLTTDYCTCLGKGLNLVVNELHKRRSFYKRQGISSYKPWVILMTDGAPNDNWGQPAAEMRNLAENHKIWYLGVEIGPEADHNTMCEIMPLISPPFKLDGMRFQDFFKWLSDSLQSVSHSAVSDENEAQFPQLDWADLSNM